MELRQRVLLGSWRRDSALSRFSAHFFSVRAKRRDNQASSVTCTVELAELEVRRLEKKKKTRKRNKIKEFFTFQSNTARNEARGKAEGVPRVMPVDLVLSIV